MAKSYAQAVDLTGFTALLSLSEKLYITISVPAMKFEKLTPMMWVPDLQSSIDFYTRVLGFTCAEYSQDWGWAALSRDETDIMLALPNEHIPFQGAQYTGTFYIRVDNADELWAELKDKVEVVYGIDDFDYGMREFCIRDNNGYMIQFGHEIPGQMPS